MEEARPAWFLRENVPKAPDIKPAGYDVRSFLLDHSTLDSGDSWGHEQMRRRRFWVGTRDVPCPELRRWIDFALFVLPGIDRAVSVDAGHDKLDGAEAIGRYRERIAAVCDARETPVALGGSGKVKRRQQAVSGRHESNGMGGTPGITPGNNAGNPPRYTLAEMCELQGLPPGFLDHSPFTMQAKRRLIGNGVPLGMGRALARAIRRAMEEA